MSEIKKLNDSKTIEVLNRLLDTIKYGSITLVVQDGKVIQIESQEKIRLK